MSDYRLSHLDDATLLHDLTVLVARDQATTAALLAHIAEVDARRLYLAAAHPSMFAYCIGTLGFSEDAAYKRIQAARAARRFPRLFDDVAAGRLHLTAVGLLAPHLTGENVDDLVTMAIGRRKAEIEFSLAERFAPMTTAVARASVVALRPRRERAHRNGATPASVDVANPGELAPAQVDGRPPSGGTAPETSGSEGDLLSSPSLPLAPEPPSDPADPPASGSHAMPSESGSGTPAPESKTRSPHLVLRIPLDAARHARLREAQALLAHSVPSGDLLEIFDRALDALIATASSRKYGATTRPRRTPAPSSRPRTIPAHVRRAVRQRDGDRCTFTSTKGRRCAERKLLEFDHIVPAARGGESSARNLTLRCRAHNQFEAERAFGREFMQSRRARSLERPRRAPS